MGDATLQKMYDEGSVDDAVALATQTSSDLGTQLLSTWAAFFGELFVRFRDGYDIAVKADDTECGCSVANDPYRPSWYDRIVAETGDHLLDLDFADADHHAK